MQHSKQKYSETCSQSSTGHPHWGQVQIREILWGEGGREDRLAFTENLDELQIGILNLKLGNSVGSRKLYRSLGQASTKQCSF